MTLAFVFPGQGSQAVGMSSALATEFPVVKQTYAEASQALGYDLWEIVTNRPIEELNRTQVTQPAMLTAGVATWRAWISRNGPRPVVMAGHSLGEYTALVCADVLTFADAVTLVADRARFMQEAVPAGQGAMAAIVGLDDDAVRSVCEQAAQGDVVEAVNFNSPGQVVIAGSASAVARAIEQAKAAGAKLAVALPVSVPSHCRLMRPAAERMTERLAQATFAAASVPVIHNVHVQTETSAIGIRTALARQIESPVRWVETVRKIADEGVTRIIECGPGKVLTGLNKRTTDKARTFAVYDPATLAAGLTAVQS